MQPFLGTWPKVLPFRCLEQNLGCDFWQREMHRVQRDSIFRPERGVCVFWSSIPMRMGVYHRCCGHILILLMPCPVLTTCGLPGEFCAGRVALSCVSPFLSCRLKLVLLGISGKPEPPYRDHCLGTERLSYPMPADNDLFCFTSFCK